MNFLKYHLKHLPTHYEVNNSARRQRQHHKLRQAPPCRQPGAYPSDSANVLQASDSDPHKSATVFPISRSLDISLLRDLKLMHHFTAIAWQILPKGYGRQELWQIELPRLALEHDLLLHQLLAFSAYYLAYSTPDRRTMFLIQASQHQNLAILAYAI